MLRHLRENPSGLSAFALRTSHNVKAQCQLSVPCIGRAGDAFLMHPQMLHASSQNVKRIPRFMRNGQVRLSAPMWTAPTLSPVERCSLRCLGDDWSGGTTRAPKGFCPPPDELRGACDHDDGGLLGWAYGARPSYREGTGSGTAVSSLATSCKQASCIVVYKILARPTRCNHCSICVVSQPRVHHTGEDCFPLSGTDAWLWRFGCVQAERGRQAENERRQPSTTAKI